VPGTPGTFDDQQFFADLPGVRTVTFDVPYLRLVRSGDNVPVCEWGPHTSSYVRDSHPTELMAEIDALFGPHPAVSIQYESRWHQPRAIDRLADALCDGVRRRATICRWLLGRYPDHEFFLAVMTEGHSAGEAFGHGPRDETPLVSASTAGQAGRRLRDVYRALNAPVGETASTVSDGTALVVFALHGLSAESNDVASTVLLPELLYRLRFGRSFLRLLGHRVPGELTGPAGGFDPGGMAGARRGAPDRISVIVPARDPAATIGGQLAALAAQRYEGSWEVIVADNGSADATVADRWIGRIPGLRVVDASGRRGASHARNVGIAASRGDFLAGWRQCHGQQPAVIWSPDISICVRGMIRQFENGPVGSSQPTSYPEASGSFPSASARTWEHFRDFRCYGATRAGFADTVRFWAGAIRRLPRAISSRARRGAWRREVAWRSGRLSGSVRYRVWFP
jgi:Glycosyl transferase family 2